MKKSIFLIFIGSWWASCISLQKKELWDIPSTQNLSPHISNFYGLNIATEGLSSEVWFTQNPKCLQIKTETETVYNGAKSLFLKWDKQAGNCEWLGMGIGWDGWTGKNLSSILDKAAIQIKAHSKTGKVKSLPLAAAFEDYGGLTAWLGFSPQYIEHKEGEDWATITLPLNDFSWDQFDADAGNIKQLIIQFEASGEVFFDEIKVVPYDGSLKSNYFITSLKNDQITLNLWPDIFNQTNPIFLSDGSKLGVYTWKDNLVVVGKVMDKSPLENGQKDDNIWNGDALELAISTSEQANPRRKSLLYSDQHFGVKLGDETYVFDFKRKVRWPEAEIQTKKTPDGYQFLVIIPQSKLGIKQWNSSHTYQMELALDKGDIKKRTQQLRWNNEKQEGFHQNPSLWGKVTFEF